MCCKTDLLLLISSELSLGHYTAAYQEEQEQFFKCTLRILHSVNWFFARLYKLDLAVDLLLTIHTGMCFPIPLITFFCNQEYKLVLWSYELLRTMQCHNISCRRWNTFKTLNTCNVLSNAVLRKEKSSWSSHVVLFRPVFRPVKMSMTRVAQKMIIAKTKRVEW